MRLRNRWLYRAAASLLACLLFGTGSAGGGQMPALTLHYVASVPAGGYLQEFTVRGDRAVFFAYDRQQRAGRSGAFRLSPGEVQELISAGGTLRSVSCASPEKVADDLRIDLTLNGMRLRCGESGLPGSQAEALVQLIRRLIASHLSGRA